MKVANAILMLFSIVPSQIEFACQQFQKRTTYSSGIIDEMIRIYRKEDRKMAITLEEIDRKVKQEWLRNLTPAQRLEGLPAEERLKGLPRKDFVKAILRDELEREPTAEEVDAFLSKMKVKG